MPLAILATSADAAETDNAEGFAEHLHAFEWLPVAGADVAVHAREIPAGRHHQRDGLLGHGGVAIALDGMDLHAQRFDLGHIHVARRAGAEEHDVLEVLALRDQIGRHVAVIVDGDVMAADDARQLVLLERHIVDLHRRIVRTIDAIPHLAELRVAVDENGFHAWGLLPHRPAQLAQSVDVVEGVACVHPAEHVRGLTVLQLGESFADLGQRHGAAEIDPVDGGEDDGGYEHEEQFPHRGGNSSFQECHQ